MATIIKVKGADFSANAVGFIPPVAADLAGWFFPNGSLAQAKRNLAPGGADAAVTGAPVIGTAYTRFKGRTNYLDTGLAETPAITLLAVARAVIPASGSAQALIVSNYGSGTGVSLTKPQLTAPSSVSGTENVYAGFSAPTGLATASAVVSNGTAWAFTAGVVTPGTGLQFIDKTRGLLGSLSTATARSLGTSSLLIGSGYDISWTGESDIAFAAIYTRALEAAEIDTVYQFVKTYLAKRSITV